SRDVMGASPGDLIAIGCRLAREGTTSWLPTAITAPLDRLDRVNAATIGAMEELSRGAGADSAAILGMHLEGPFISDRRLGVHPHFNVAPRGEALRRVLAMRSLRLITMAPELPGALTAIRRLASRGVAVSIGHTDATLEEANRGIAAGARMFTHLFNAMRPMHHRDPGVIAAALAPSPALAAIIPDGVHVHPAMLGLAYRARGRAGVLIVTDKVAVRARRKRAIGHDASAKPDAAARLADGRLAGGLISMLDGVRLMVDKAGASIADAGAMAAANPAHLIGATDRGRLMRGARADLLILNSKLELKAVFLNGQEIG
ncbi:MAG TPA: amidohydrolase family protein, partial [Candidatus Binataceae bacterium]|nr:amidohydrolase family protein [Candidatus Binataceae bacterium]